MEWLRTGWQLISQYEKGLNLAKISANKSLSKLWSEMPAGLVSQLGVSLGISCLSSAFLIPLPWKVSGLRQPTLLESPPEAHHTFSGI